jgi:tRNA dimethylallyltransferase
MPTKARSFRRLSSKSSRRKSGIATPKPERSRAADGAESTGYGGAVVVLFGPTAVGKSELLFSLFDSRFEVINADSMQVYRHMDIGTAKPSREALAALPHHMIDVADPSEQFNAGRFVKGAEALIAEIRARGKIPLLCGGTAFYITSFLFGLPESPPVNAEVRERLRALERTEGSEALHRMLKQKDAAAAARIDPNDRYRTARALEVMESTGRSLFSFHWPRTLRAEYDFLTIGLERDRQELYDRIERRVRRMFDGGLVGEVGELLAMGYRAGDPGMRGIGYRELLAMREGCQTLGETRDLVARATRRYAKRQLTFFRAVPDVCWMSAAEPEAVREKVEAFCAHAASTERTGSVPT